MCDLTDADAQGATFRACRSVNPGISIISVPQKASKSHLGFCMALCTWQHERGALYIVILTDSEETLSKEQFLALETLHQKEERASLGRHLKQVRTGTRLESNIPAMSRARVWTNSFTVAAHIQREAIGKEGPLHREELFYLLETVIQGKASSGATQYAQRLRDTADEELVAPRETFVAAAHREPDLAEAAEAEVDEKTPSLTEQRQLLRAHVNLGRPTIGEFCRA